MRVPRIRVVAACVLAVGIGLAALGAAREWDANRSEDELVAYGRALFVDTPKLAKANIRVGMSCAACHLDAGLRPHGGSLVGTATRFPQWNERAKRFITLEDRITECFLYSMNGQPPAPYSRETIALTAYITSLSRGIAIGSAPAGDGLVTVHAWHPPDAAAGAKLYSAQCAKCHGADGAGRSSAGIPPLWGSASFNDGAGMNHKMPAFVKANMPLGSGGTLSDQEAADVSAYVLSHARPHFDRNRMIAFPPEPAGFF
jgi:thiosulfate dehydrogenase